MNTFSTKEALKFGWETTKKNFWFLTGLTLLCWVVGYLPQLLDSGHSNRGSWVITIAAALLSAWVQLGSMRILLALVDGKQPSFALMKMDIKSPIYYFVASILVGILVAAGLFLLVVPGIMVALAVGMYGYRIIDAKAGIVDSLKQSAAITKGHRWNLLGLGIVIFLLNMVGAMLALIGLLITMPVTMVAYAYVYRKLTQALEPVVVTSSAPALIKDLQKTV